MRNRRCLAAAAIMLGVGAGPAIGATISWNVTADGVWDTTTPNWTGDAATYTEGDDVTIILTGGTNRTITIDRDGDTSLADVNPGSTIFDVSSGRTLTVNGGIIQSGTVTKTGAGTVLFDGYNQSFGFDSLTIEGGTFRYRDSSDNPLANNDVISVGAGPITLNGGTFTFSFGFSTAPGVTVTNDFIVGAAGGGISTDRRTANPRTTFTGNITLGGDLLLSKGGGGNGEPTQTYTGTITLTGGDRAIRGSSNFNNNTFPQILGNIVEDGTPRQLTLAMATTSRQFIIGGTGNTYSGGTVIEAGNGFIRVLADSSLGLGDVTVLDGGELRLEGFDNISDLATLSIEDGGFVALNFTGVMNLAGLVLDGEEQSSGFYDADSFSQYFGGTGQIFIAESTAPPVDGVIPEPASIALLSLGGLMLMRRRNRA